MTATELAEVANRLAKRTVGITVHNVVGCSCEDGSEKIRLFQDGLLTCRLKRADLDHGWDMDVLCTGRAFDAVVFATGRPVGDAHGLYTDREVLAVFQAVLLEEDLRLLREPHTLLSVWEAKVEA